MEVFADLHIHGKYSRATSKYLSIPKLEKYAKIKGLHALGTGDFTHPKWYNHLKENLDNELRTKTGFQFILQTEISLIYKQEKTRKVHLVILVPDFGCAEQLTSELLKKGRVDYDGRPIFKIPCPEFVEISKSISEEIEIIPAHIWTPWFSLFGSKSGFDSIEECFQDQLRHINALETGLSSDPEMNRMWSALDKYTLVSNSDAHSYWPWRLGRECNIIKTKKITYKSIIDSIRKNKITTIEMWPDQGKYHYDGHRKCGIVFSPEQTKKHNGICPVCNKKLTIGVMNRVKQLSDKNTNTKSLHCIPLSELISKTIGCGVNTKTVWNIYNKLIKTFDNEYNVLLNVKAKELYKNTSKSIAKTVIKNRKQQIKVKPGYDGKYGEPIIHQDQQSCNDA